MTLWNERVAREAVHETRVEAAFDEAEARALAGDFEQALGCGRTPMSAGFQFTLRGETEAAWDARRAIADNDPTLPGSLRDDLSLLVTELVTNAVRHGGATAGGAIKIEIQRHADSIRVDVVDPGTDFDPPAPPANGDSSGGWGLFLVDQIAERWGVRTVPTGTCVWFELPVGATL